MSEGYSPLEVCLACGLAGRSQFHFGGSSCTACASFFRRTVSLNIRFVCKRDRACISSPALRSICRACRYECCVSKAGMNRDLVQQRRNQTRIPKYVLNSRKDGSSEIIRDYTTNSYTTLHEFSKPDKPGFSKILNISDMGLLEFYVKQVAVGKMEKNPLNITSASELLEIALSHQDLALESCTTCPGTDLLDQKDIEILFRYCSFSITWMDSIWEEASKENCLEASLEGKGEEDSLPCFISHLKSTLIPSFSRLQLNIFEFAALKSFCIWKLGVHDSSISMKVVAQEQYVSVTSALRKYYESSTTMESFEIATRIAEITLQIGPIFGAYREMLRVYEGLGISLSMPISEN